MSSSSTAPAILHFVHWPVSGIIALLKALLQQSDMQKYRHYLLLCEGNKSHLEFFDGLIEAGAVLESHGKLAVMTKLPELLRQWQPSLIHSHSFQPSFWTRCWRTADVPHLRTIHNCYPYFTDKGVAAAVKRKLEHWALSGSNTKTVAVSDQASQQFADAYQLPVETLVNGVNRRAVLEAATHAPTDADQWLARRNDKRVLVSCGRLHPQKGFDLAIEAFARLRETHPKLELWLIGEGEQRTQLESKASALGIENQIVLLGHQSNPYWFLSQADIYLACSRYEGFGLATLEAMCLGLPVVASPGATEPLGLSSESAFCLSELTATDLAKGISEVLNSDQLQTKLAEQARVFSQHYSISYTADAYLQHYAGMMGEALAESGSV
ncbi:glycosyltransferase [Corallincola platygyrae]|uniref:Glycosyltransferase n=1 Tax=Corallincola platygyrae TaxID=1193278 RepID=A0ABW4XNS4_9GAMM